MKAGDTVILDKEFNNKSEVVIVTMTRYYSRVRDCETRAVWDVMTSRLSPIGIPVHGYELLGDQLQEGPYKGKTLHELVSVDPEYVLGLINTTQYSPSPVAMRLINTALQRKKGISDMRELTILDDETYYLTD